MTDTDSETPAARALYALWLLRGYGRGWDGYDALPPNKNAIDDAARWVRDAPEVAYDVDSEPDGTVTLGLDTDHSRMILAFSGDGFAYVAERVDGAWREGAVYPI